MKNVHILCYEAGAGHTPVPVWASETENPLDLKEEDAVGIQRVEVSAVPGVFQLLNVLSEEECKKLIEASEAMGYSEDASISLPRSVRHNENLVWILDDSTHDLIWKRCEPFMEDAKNLYHGKKALGLNKRFRFYKYGVGDFFQTHTDGAWPGSAVINKKLVNNAYPDRYSQMTFLIFLNDGYTGGKTRFLVDKDDGSKPARKLTDTNCADISTPKGGVLCFPHGTHPLHCMHSSTEINSGVKYIIRSDVLFEL